MPEDNSPALLNLNLGDVSKSLEIVTENFCKAIGSCCKPKYTVQMAKAIGEARIIIEQAAATASAIRVHTDVYEEDVRRRAKHRREEEDIQRQLNMESIAGTAILHLNADAKPEAVNSDWITNFFDKCRIVSDSEMQDLWARVLAGEANSPGSFSKRTINFISELEKSDAELISKIFGFCLTVGEEVTLAIFNWQDPIYTNNKVAFGSLIYLESIGVLSFNQQKFALRFSAPVIPVRYFDKTLNLERPDTNFSQLEMGSALLTNTGRELAQINQFLPVEGFWEYLQEKWAKYLPKKQEDAAPASQS
ncbi:MAG: DUF2806 domain-containing protein [Verrucomicrobiota bacterium]